MTIYTMEFDKSHVFGHEFDPIQREPIFEDICSSKIYSVGVQLLQWMRRNVPTISYFAINDFGCDVAFLIESLHQVRHVGWPCPKPDKKVLIDAIIAVDGGTTAIHPFYKGEKVDAYAILAGGDRFIICREFQRNHGHGIRWLEIDKDQVKQLCKEHNDALPN